MAAGAQERRGRNPANSLTDDLIVRILSRLPVKSICCCRCASPSWRDLIAHPDHRKKLPQTLAGFFYHTWSHSRSPESSCCFTNISGRGAPLIRPSLPFLRRSYSYVAILDSCNGLLLCRCWAAGAFHYVVCNPATEEWVPLPGSGQVEPCTARLGFDPAVSAHFHVFEFVKTDLGAGNFYVDGLYIYSSETRKWAYKDSELDYVSLDDDVSTVFLNGFLHVFVYHICNQDVLAVDTEGKVWRTIRAPKGQYDGFIGQSQGRLYYLNRVKEYDYKLSVFVLEDYTTNEWIFKHIVSTPELLGMEDCFLPKTTMYCYRLMAIHPECHLIFFVSLLDDTIRCYDMDRRIGHVIHNMECELDSERCLPYVPLYSKSLPAWKGKAELASI